MVCRKLEDKSKPMSNFYCLFTIQPLMMHGRETSVALADLGNDEELVSLTHTGALLVS